MTYETPKSETSEATCARLLRGRRMIVAAIILNLVGTLVRFGPHEPIMMKIGLFSWLGAFVLSIVGIVLLARPLRLTPTMAVFTAMLIFMPFASLVVLIVLFARAGAELHERSEGTSRGTEVQH